MLVGISIHGNLTSRTFRTETVQFYSLGSSILLTNNQDEACKDLLP